MAACDSAANQPAPPVPPPAAPNAGSASRLLAQCISCYEVFRKELIYNPEQSVEGFENVCVIADGGDGKRCCIKKRLDEESGLYEFYVVGQCGAASAPTATAPTAQRHTHTRPHPPPQACCQSTSPRSGRRAPTSTSSRSGTKAVLRWSGSRRRGMRAQVTPHAPDRKPWSCHSFTQTS